MWDNSAGAWNPLRLTVANADTLDGIQSSGYVQSDSGSDVILRGTLANRPAAGTANRWYFTTDNNGVYYDDGAAWHLVAEHPTNISASDLAFDPATQSELDNHVGASNPHGVSLEEARSQNNTFGGNVSLGGNSITNIGQGSAISGSSIDAKYDGTTNYGYFAVRNNNGRGAYFGWGNGSGVVQVVLDNASTLRLREGDLDVDGNYIDNRSGFLTGYLTTTQSNVDGGAYSNCFENLEVNDGPYTKDSASQITVNRSGKYRVEWHCTFRQDGGGSRTIMQAYPEFNGNGRGEFRGSCYIRNTSSGDANTADNSVVVNLTSGDTVRIWSARWRGDSNSHELENATCTIEYLG
jgi:hypothetical protein